MDAHPPTIPLTATESRLLEVLRSQPGRAFSRAELVTLVRPGSAVQERTIDAHVNSLRQKLGPMGSRIQTVRQVGYRYADG
jgi:DNA-binding response OmpR family regulator